MPEMVCCPVCWNWSQLGGRLTCKKCGAQLVFANGRSVAELASPPEAAVPAAVAGGVAPAPPPPALEASAGTRRRFGVLRAAAAAGVAILVAGAVAGGILAFRFLHGSADSLVAMAPSDGIAYVNINLDPSGGQKLAIASLLDKFPGLSDSARDSTINDWLDTALTGSGLNHNDVRAWLGSEISVVVLPGSGSAPATGPAVVVLLSSTNDSAAQATLDKLRSSASASSLQWTTTMQDGVSVNTGTGSGRQAVAYAVDSGTVIIGDDAAGVAEVVDTAHGKHANLQSTTDYTTVQSQLPSDRVASLFVDVPVLVKTFGSALNATGASASQALSAFNAYRGVGAALVVSSNGVTVDATQDYDSSQLSSDQRAALSVPAHINGSLALTPPSAYGFLSVTGIAGELRTLLDPKSSGAALFQPVLDQLGLTGTGGIIDHLTGDAGVEVDAQPGSKIPAGALLFQVDSADAARTFLSTFAGKVCAMAAGVCTPGQQTTQSHDGVDITSIGLSGSGVSGVSPSYALSGGWAIIASSADEVKAVLDAQHGAGIATSPRFNAVAGQVGASNASMFYVDIHGIVAAVRAALPPGAAATFDQNVAPYVSHFEAFGGASQNAGDHTTSTLFLLID